MPEDRYIDNEENKLLTVNDVAKILQVSKESVRRYTREGELPSVKLGGKYIRIRQEDLNAFIQEHLEGVGEVDNG